MAEGEGPCIIIIISSAKTTILTFGAFERSAIRSLIIMFHKVGPAVLVGPCHHGMARPQVADRGTASDKNGSCE